MDLTVTRFQDVYKSRTLRFGTAVQPAALSQRVHNLHQQRQISRNTVIMSKRKINEDKLTPIASPATEKKKKAAQVVVQDERKDNRLELLRKWQEEKQKRLEKQKTSKKPLFKVHHVSVSTEFNLDAVYGQIKGKPIAASAKKNARETQPRLAPSSSYKFKPPANIKPINLRIATTAGTHDPRIKAEVVPTNRVTRSQKPHVSPLSLPARTRQRLNFQTVATKQNNLKKGVPLKAGSKVVKQDNSELPGTSQLKTARMTKKGGKVASIQDEEVLAHPLDAEVEAQQSRKRLSRSLGPLEQERSTKALNRKRHLRRQNSIDLASPDLYMNVVQSNRKTALPESSDDDAFLVKDVSLQKGKRGKNQKTKPESASSASSSVSSDYPIADGINTTNSASTSSQPVTPLNKCSGSNTYVSPFVTMSRGKENARKEFHRRSVRGGADAEKSTSPKAAAIYFYNLLKNETERFQILCQQWNRYKDQEEPPEEVCDMINVAVGQTQLLLTKKFQQFKGLVKSCETEGSEKPVTCLDLHGFWDMIKIQVQNLNKRFENLELLKSNGWIEILPVAKPKTTKPKRKPRGKNVTTSGSSSLRAAIQEARKKKPTELSNNEELLLPLDSIEIPKMETRSSRRSIRSTVSTSEAKRSIDSPGLAMMRVSQVAKSVEKSRLVTPKNDKARISPKSILKSEQSKSVRRKTKVVLFKDNRSSPQEEQENNQNLSNMLLSSPPRAVKRRSMRLSKRMEDS